MSDIKLDSKVFYSIGRAVFRGKVIAIHGDFVVVRDLDGRMGDTTIPIDCCNLINENDAASPPPVGLMPRKIFLEHRAIDILDAMRRYLVEGKEIPAEWVVELSGILIGIKS